MTEVAIFQRVGRALHSGPCVEISDARWLQVGDYYADIRFLVTSDGDVSPFDRSQAFSGMVTTTQDTISWTHDLDTEVRPPGNDDTASFTWEDDVLVEVGEDYLERWQVRRPGVGARGDVAEFYEDGASKTLSARLVRVGDQAVMLWGGHSPGGAFLAFDVRWRTVGEVGSRWRGGDPVEIVTQIDDRATLPPGWTIREQLTL